MHNDIECKHKELAELYKLCCGNEAALSSSVVCMTKMINALGAMELSDFYLYEREILRAPLLGACNYFIEMVNAALLETDNKKKELIDEIEDSMMKLYSAFKDIVHGTANYEQSIMSNVVVDTDMFENSPKLCLFYSVLLNALAQIYKPEGEMSFLLQITMQSNAYTEYLFDNKKFEGKVSLITLSHGMTTDVQTTMVNLVHEGFHVLTTKPRRRKERSMCLLSFMQASLIKLILQDVDCGDPYNKMIWRLLFKSFLGRLKNEANIYTDGGNDDKIFYGENLKKKMREIFYDIIGHIGNEFPDAVEDAIYGTCSSYEGHAQEFRKALAIAKHASEQISFNISNMIYQNTIENLIALFLSLFREVYADIACMITTNYSVSVYASAFEKSISFRKIGKALDKTEADDMFCELRKYYVSDAIAHHLEECPDKTRAEEWGRFHKEKSASLKQKNKTSSRHEGIKYDIFFITEDVNKGFMRHFRACAVAFYDLQRQSACENLNRIRDMFANVQDLTSVLKDSSKYI